MIRTGYISDIGQQANPVGSLVAVLGVEHLLLLNVTYMLSFARYVLV